MLKNASNPEYQQTKQNDVKAPLYIGLRLFIGVFCLSPNINL